MTTSDRVLADYTVEEIAAAMLAAPRPPLVALDLFAGTGWGVACERLGIREYGVEVMPEAVAVREVNGMRTIYHDVWEGLVPKRIYVNGNQERSARRAEDLPAPTIHFGRALNDVRWDEEMPASLDYDLLIASPPCQTFSMAGSGAGRRALDEVLGAIDARLYLDPATLVAFGERHDPKTALVLAPLAHIARDTPMYVVLEQVPPVLPVWERYAEEMRRWGYSVWTGNLQAEQYGVPQTRRRAILIARADGKEAKCPPPTHNRYNPRAADGGRYADPALLPWVSMVDALGWGMTERPMVTAGNAVGRAEGVGGSGAKAAILREQGRGAWVGNQVPGGREKGDYQTRDGDLPAPTVTAASRSAKIMRSNYSAGGEGTAEERGRTMRPDTEPALTMTSKGAQWQEGDDPLMRPAPTVTGGGTAAGGGAEVFGRHGRAIIEKMWEKRPSTTVAADDRIAGPGRSEFVKGGVSRQDRPGSTRVTVEEAAALQSYPADFVWDAEFTDPKTGRRKAVTKTNKFLQIGNAVPPGLAEAILREVLS